MDGAKEGFYIGIENILPAMVLGYVIIRFLELTGLVNLIGKVFAPVMGIFGLPGDAAGTLNAAQATILVVPCMLMGTLVGHYARIVLVAGTNPKYRSHLLGLPILLSLVGMLGMRGIMMLMGYM